MENELKLSIENLTASIKELTESIKTNSIRNEEVNDSITGFMESLNKVPYEISELTKKIN